MHINDTPAPHTFHRALYSSNACRCGRTASDSIHFRVETPTPSIADVTMGHPEFRSPLPPPPPIETSTVDHVESWDAAEVAETAAFKKQLLAGVGPEAPKVTNEMGGQQSKLDYRFDLLDPAAIFALAAVLHYGVNVRGYPANNWRAISVEENLNHCMMHIMAHLAGDTQDQHLEHAFTRMMFALGVQLQGGPKPQ